MAFDISSAQPVNPGGGFDVSTAKPVAEDVGAGDFLRRIGRQVGLTARAGIQGVTALPNMIGDAAGLKSSQAVRNALTKFGLPDAENPTERIVQDAAGGMAGAGSMVGAGRAVAGAGNALVRRIGEVLSTAPASQVAAGTTGPGAASAVREEGGGPGAQLAAGVAGTFVPSLHAAAAATVRGLVRGGEAGRQRVAQNIKTFEDAGAGTPTVGQATESSTNRAIESVLAKSPGATGRFAAKAEEEAAGLGDKVDEMAGALAPRAGAAPAGRQIKSGLEHFVDEFKGQSTVLYDALDRHIPKGTQVEVGNTRETLAKLNADIPGAPNLSKWFKNAKIAGIEGALNADTSGMAAAEQSMNPFKLGMLKQLPMSDAERASMFNAFTEGKLPYEALKKLRTLVGNEISDSTIASDVPRSKWRPLYGALTKDMEAAATAAGPKAQAAFSRANTFHRAGMRRLDEVLGPIMKQGDPEDVFRAALSGTQEGATTIAGVMKSLPEESRKAVAATMLQRLGKATPGKQNELGEVFSTETFLTNWNKLHPDAKRSLFSTLPEGMRRDLTRISEVAANMREGSKVFANPSGTSQSHIGQWTAGAFVLSLMTGQLHSTAGIAGLTAASNVSARAMTSPTVVRWLSKATRKPVEQLPAQLNSLFQESMYLRGDERKDVRRFITEVRSGTQSAGQPTLQKAPDQQ